MLVCTMYIVFQIVIEIKYCFSEKIKIKIKNVRVYLLYVTRF